MKTTITTLRILYFALIVGTGGFLAVSAFLFAGRRFTILEEDLVPVVLVSPAFIGGLLVLIGILTVKNKLHSLTNLSTEEKLQQFRPLMITRAATMEGACFLFTVLFIVFGYELFLYEAVFCLAILIVYFPTNSRISSELNIDIRELNDIN